MLTVADRQVGLFDAGPLCEGLIAGGSFYALLAEHGDRIVSDRGFADCYSETTGRPSIPPSLLAKILLLQYREGLSDGRAMEAVRLHLGWKVALGLPIDHAGFHPTTLVKFRARMLLHGKERLALERTLVLATEVGLMEGSVEQIVDSTPMLGAAATQDTVTLVRAGVGKLLAAVREADEETAAGLETGLEFDYRRPRHKPDCDWRDKTEREAMLTRVAQDAERALRAVEAVPELIEDESVERAHALLRELIGQDFDVDDDGIPRLHRGTRQGRILSLHDPEMRHGRKSKRQRFDGYKLHASATNGVAPLITTVEVEPASEPDGPQAKALVDCQPETCRPARILGDMAYGNQDVREQMEQRSVEVLAPPATSKANPVFAKEQFEIDLGAGTVTCPAGKVAGIGSPSRNGQRTAHFRCSDCRACPLKPRCTQSEQRNVTLARREDLLVAARQALDDPDNAEHLRRTRPRIERLLGLLAHRYGARKSRYRGKLKARLQALWTAALVNLNPIGDALRAAPARAALLPTQPPHRAVPRNRPRPTHRTGFSDVF